MRLAFYFTAAVLLLNLVVFYFAPLLRLKWRFPDKAPTRLLLVGDPQLLGDAHIRRKGIIDLLFNDFYMRHVYQMATQAVQPTHAIFLGDIFSAQTIDDDEFERRAKRFRWIFKTPPSVQVFSMVGNHDIGYGADINAHRIERFEREFNRTNDLILLDKLKLVFVNSMLLDGVAFYLEEERNRTWEFVKQAAEIRPDLKTLLFTHIPLHKPPGLCADDPDVEYDYEWVVKWQNMLSPEATHSLLTYLKPLAVFSGHDHEGCFARRNSEGLIEEALVLNQWWPGVEASVESSHTFEFTLRSVMAEFGGALGVMELLDDGKFAFQSFRFLRHTTLWIWLALNGVYLFLLAIYLIYKAFRTHVKQD